MAWHIMLECESPPNVRTIFQCATDNGSVPMARVKMVAEVGGVLRNLGHTAVRQGWTRKQGRGWYCPECSRADPK